MYSGSSSSRRRVSSFLCGSCRSSCSCFIRSELATWHPIAQPMMINNKQSYAGHDPACANLDACAKITWPCQSDMHIWKTLQIGYREASHMHMAPDCSHRNFSWPRTPAHAVAGAPLSFFASLRGAPRGHVEVIAALAHGIKVQIASIEWLRMKLFHQYCLTTARSGLIHIAQRRCTIRRKEDTRSRGCCWQPMRLNEHK